MFGFFDTFSGQYLNFLDEKTFKILKNSFQKENFQNILLFYILLF